MRKLFLCLTLLSFPLWAGAQKYATPETFEKPGPYAAGMDFSMVAAAQTPGVTFLGGDETALQGGDPIDYLIDFSKAKVGKKNFLEQYKAADNNKEAVEELEELTKMCRTYFHTNYNQRNKGTKVNKDNENTGRIMEIHVLKMDTGSGWGSVLISDSIKDGESAVSGYVTVVDAQTKKILAVYAFNDVSSGSSLSKKLRIATPFAQLGIKLRKAATN